MHVVCAATARSLVMHASSQRMAVVFRMITSSPLFNPITNYVTSILCEVQLNSINKIEELTDAYDVIASFISSTSYHHKANRVETKTRPLIL
ncbi:unnamed protein product [Brugia pahangi]|uniref:Secreted protein n=1 Tax=Brugia pahangi TaxID=6280 RepID=A0A0N4TJF7_BRUPA|nr:unnamed protein product [Brugia pahangi]